jgi:transcriptional regulator with XRE-family HTH domain
VDHGPTTAAVAAALTRLQGEGRWRSLRQLSAALAELPGGGIKLSHTSIGQIVRGERHVTVDELTALAAVLGVSPVTLLMPFTDDPSYGLIELTGTGDHHAGPLLEWLQGVLPLGLDAEAQDPFETEAFQRRSLPRWAWPERK